MHATANRSFVFPTHLGLYSPREQDEKQKPKMSTGYVLQRPTSSVFWRLSVERRQTFSTISNYSIWSALCLPVPPRLASRTLPQFRWWYLYGNRFLLYPEAFRFPWAHSGTPSKI